MRLASVATPDFAHHAPVRALLDAGADVLCEKPLTTDLVQARDLLAAAEPVRAHPLGQPLQPLAPAPALGQRGLRERARWGARCRPTTG